MYIKLISRDLDNRGKKKKKKVWSQFCVFMSEDNSVIYDRHFADPDMLKEKKKEKNIGLFSTWSIFGTDRGIFWEKIKCFSHEWPYYSAKIFLILNHHWKARDLL